MTLACQHGKRSNKHCHSPERKEKVAHCNLSRDKIMWGLTWKCCKIEWPCKQWVYKARKVLGTKEGEFLSEWVDIQSRDLILLIISRRVNIESCKHDCFYNQLWFSKVICSIIFFNVHVLVKFLDFKWEKKSFRYNLVRSCPKPPMVKLSKKDNSELKTQSKTYLEVSQQ